jgi:excisionase family DNA binding protein
MPRLKESTRIARETATMEPPTLTFSNAPDILTRTQVAQLLQIGQSTLDTCVPSKDLPRVKFGKTVRYLRTDVEQYVFRNRIEGED